MRGTIGTGTLVTSYRTIRDFFSPCPYCPSRYGLQPVSLFVIITYKTGKLLKYTIGIDLGTTNSAASYASLDAPQIHNLKIPQLNSLGSEEFLPTLPSFCYLDKNAVIVGTYALHQGARTPTKLVHSAKSWLCHSAAPRRDRILPIEGSDKISPVDASRRYISQIRDSWNKQIAKGDIDAEFEQQEIILTVPASFDEVARALTVEAAKQAGATHLTLLEEPQAAFYAWIEKHTHSWSSTLNNGDIILVCDVGGGTTDFSLIEMRSNKLNRIAVGNHLLLGGDNMDSAVAHFMEKQLSKELEHVQFLQLRHEARKAKEALLSGQESYDFVLKGAGAKVVGGSLKASVSKNEILSLLVDGFFGSYAWDEAQKLSKSRGIRSMGLPYEDDPSITKHLADFLAKHPYKPRWVLFNGGTLKPVIFRNQIIENLRNWFPEHKIEELESVNFDLAVARGAAYYGLVKHGLGVKIGGGSARSYYLQVGLQGQTPKALTLLPRGSEEGATYEPGQIFDLKANTGVAFNLYTSHTRLHDQPGDLIPIDPEELQSLPPIHTLLRFGKTQNDIPVHLQIALTPVGTLELALKSMITNHRWNLEFQVRGEESNSPDKILKDEFLDPAQLDNAKVLIQQLFAIQIKSQQIMDLLEKAADRPRKEWTPGFLRGLWTELLSQAAKRKQSNDLSARWWNLAGYLLRPGYGFPLDAHRMKDLWKIILGDFNNSLSPDVLIQLLICCRRCAGGFNKGQQTQIGNLIVPALLNTKYGKILNRNKIDPNLVNEQVRTLGSLELIDLPTKIRIGDHIISSIVNGESTPAEYWAIGRIGARHLLHGSLINAVPKETCAIWIEKLLNSEHKNLSGALFAFEMLARHSTQRELQTVPELCARILDKFSAHEEIDRLRKLLLEEVSLTHKEQEQVYGEGLPPGLTMRDN